MQISQYPLNRSKKKKYWGKFLNFYMLTIAHMGGLDTHIKVSGELDQKAVQSMHHYWLFYKTVAYQNSQIKLMDCGSKKRP